MICLSLKLCDIPITFGLDLYNAFHIFCVPLHSFGTVLIYKLCLVLAGIRSGRVQAEGLELAQDVLTLFIAF